MKESINIDIMNISFNEHSFNDANTTFVFFIMLFQINLDICTIDVLFKVSSIL